MIMYPPAQTAPPQTNSALHATKISEGRRQQLDIVLRHMLEKTNRAR